MSGSFPHYQLEETRAFRDNALRNCTIRMRAALLLAACATTLWAQGPTHPLRTYTAPDGAFAFRYSDQLLNCEQNPGQNCSAYHSVCDGSVGQDQTSMVCFAYPRNNYTNTQAFEAATFSIEVINHGARDKDCLAMPSEQAYLTRRGNRTIRGVLFVVYEFVEGGMNQRVDGVVYRTFHRGKCYQLGINVATANAGVFDPPVREFTKNDRHEVNRRLEQARDSFQFLK